MTNKYARDHDESIYNEKREQFSEINYCVNCRDFHLWDEEGLVDYCKKVKTKELNPELVKAVVRQQAYLLGMIKLEEIDK